MEAVIQRVSVRLQADTSVVCLWCERKADQTQNFVIVDTVCDFSINSKAPN